MLFRAPQRASRDAMGQSGSTTWLTIAEYLSSRGRQVLPGAGQRPLPFLAGRKCADAFQRVGVPCFVPRPGRAVPAPWRPAAQRRRELELPAADISGEELTMVVIPKQADEFTCTSCFLVQYRSRLASHPGEPPGVHRLRLTNFSDYYLVLGRTMNCLNQSRVGEEPCRSPSTN